MKKNNNDKNKIKIKRSRKNKKRLLNKKKESNLLGQYEMLRQSLLSNSIQRITDVKNDEAK
jgi:hypothetical protein